jgi:hypothetical protein
MTPIEMSSSQGSSRTALLTAAVYVLSSIDVSAQLPISCLCVDTVAHFKARASQLYLDDLDNRLAKEQSVGRVARAALLDVWDNVQLNGRPDDFAATLLQEHDEVCNVRLTPPPD